MNWHECLKRKETISNKQTTRIKVKRGEIFGGLHLIPSQGTKIPQPIQPKKKKGQRDVVPFNNPSRC